MIDAKFIAKQKKLIEEKIAHLEGENKKNSKYQDFGTSNEDSAAEFEVFEEKQAIMRDITKDLKKLKAALLRIKNKTYGKCLKCKSTIEIGRLKVYPEASYCATHGKEEK